MDMPATLTVWLCCRACRPRFSLVWDCTSLGHVWLTVHGIESLPAWGKEGFCQLISSPLYISLDTPEARLRAGDLESESDPIYGEGFRRVRALAEQSRFEQCVETLRVNRSLPGAP
jgi:hypothetical protein